MRKYVVYSLRDALVDVTRIETVTDPYSFVLFIDKSFDTLIEAEDYLLKTMADYNKRKIENARFVILPTYYTNEDEIFK